MKKKISEGPFETFCSPKIDTQVAIDGSKAQRQPRLTGNPYKLQTLLDTGPWTMERQLGSSRRHHLAIGTFVDSTLALLYSRIEHTVDTLSDEIHICTQTLARSAQSRFDFSAVRYKRETIGIIGN